MGLFRTHPDKDCLYELSREKVKNITLFYSFHDLSSMVI